MRVERIGDCELWLGDCREVLAGLEGVDSVIVDPPFGASYTSGHATDALWGKARAIHNDTSTGVRDFIAAWAAPRPCLMFGTWRVPRPDGTKMVLIWDKGGALGMGDLKIPWKPDHEEIYVMGKGFIGSRDSGSVLRCPPVQSMAKNGRVHPNEKPVALLQALCAKVPGKVADPAMGSGSMGVACASLGRPFIGIEIDHGYFDIACRRIEAAYAQPRLFDEPAPKAVQEVML